MINHSFSESLILSGSIMVAASVIVNGNPVMYIGLGFMAWGILERFIAVFKTKK